MVCLAAVKRAAITFRMLSSGTVLNTRPSYIASTVAALAEVGMVIAVVGPAKVSDGATAVLTSALTIRPLGPDPVITAKLKPLSDAMRRARGELKMRVPLEVTGTAEAKNSTLAAATAAATTAAATAATAAATASSYHRQRHH